MGCTGSKLTKSEKGNNITSSQQEPVVEENVLVKQTTIQQNASPPVAETSSISYSPGPVTPQMYDWQLTNLELLGSDAEKLVNKSSAEAELAWQIVKDVSDNQLFVWRLERWKVNECPKEDYGKFYSGDSYIILNVHKSVDGKELLYDIHFWIGKLCTGVEYGTAAYKTVELDTFLDDKAIQHREVQGHESDLFKSYFPVITILIGCCPTDFHDINSQQHQSRLLLFKSLERHHVEMTEVEFSKRSLDSNDVFILDNGSEAFQWNGKNANISEKVKASQFLQQLESERNSECQTEIVEEYDMDMHHKFYTLLPDKRVAKNRKVVEEKFPKSLYRLSDYSGKLEFTLVCENIIPKCMLEDHDVYVIDNGKKLYVYLSEHATREERQNAFAYAHIYLQHTHHPYIPITLLSAGQKCDEFENLLQ